MTLGEIKKSLLAAVWFMFLTFPIMVIRVNTIEKTIEWRWERLLYVALGGVCLLLSLALFPAAQAGRRASGGGRGDRCVGKGIDPPAPDPRPALLSADPVLLGGLVLVFPYLFSMYQVNIMTTALIYVVTGLGLNIVVGLAGLAGPGLCRLLRGGRLHLRPAELITSGWAFGWRCPSAPRWAAALAIILGFPVLRLRGDYLAIVTLGFGEIIRLVLENWNDFSFGPSGIANIPRPGFLWFDFSLEQTAVFIYFLMIVLVLLTIFVVNRLQDSRIGRAWIALREDEIACQAMGIDITRTKLTAFAMGATWAGMAGVVFAAKTTFINPASFTIWESIVILCIVVLGGMGSILGVVLGALVLILLPEYLRAFSDYRMLIFGVVMVVMMVFRPGGIVSEVAAPTSSRKDSARTGADLMEPILEIRQLCHGFRRPAGPRHAWTCSSARVRSWP